MSLEQAYSLINERRKSNPLERGLAAGLQAYENPDVPRHSGVGRIDQAALKSSVQQAIDKTTQQQQLLQDISSRQALGLPTPTGTSAAAYNYLRGAGQYPTNPILAGQPSSALTSPTISVPYETATRIGSPTQTETSEMAAKSPSKMPTVDYGPPNMPKPSPLNQALMTFGPAALAYNYLLPQGAKDLIAGGVSSLGQTLGLSSAAPAFSGTSVVGSAPGWGYDMGTAAGTSGADIATTSAGAEGAGFTIDPVTGALVLIASQTPVGKNIVKGVSDVVSNVGSGIGNAVSSIGRAFGFAEGGETNYARGGISDLGDYSDGGRLLKGPGDGVSDSIPAVIGNKQPARLADGEFVVPARIVSELGNGSTQAGAKKLYAMMDRIQAGRKKSVGKGKVAINSRADKHLPA
jgi:hypothetical protein